MRCLVYTFGTQGDVQPYVALGSALRARGHDVLLATGQGFDSLITQAGLTSRALTIDYRALLETDEVRDALTSLSGKLRTYRALRDAMQTQYEEMWNVAKEIQPDLVVVHPKGFAGVLIARVLKVPCVATTLQPNFTPTAEFPQFLFRRSLGTVGNRLSYRLFNWATLRGQNLSVDTFKRRSLGLGSQVRMTGFNGYHPDGRALPVLHAYSKALVPKPAAWGAAERITGYWFQQPVETWTPPPELEAFIERGPAPVYVGFGSMPTQDAPRISRAVVAALKAVGARGILASGWGGLRAEVVGQDVHVIDAAPHSWLFPRCAAVVHHGGSGTTHEGLRWGRPTVVCSIGLDQPFWGRRVAHAKVGPAPIPMQALTSERLASALQSALSPECVARAEAIGGVIRAECGTQQAADCLNSLVSHLSRPAPSVGGAG